MCGRISLLVHPKPRALSMAAVPVAVGGNFSTLSGFAAQIMCRLCAGCEVAECSQAAHSLRSADNRSARRAGGVRARRLRGVPSAVGGNVLRLVAQAVGGNFPTLSGFAAQIMCRLYAGCVLPSARRQHALCVEPTTAFRGGWVGKKDARACERIFPHPH